MKRLLILLLWALPASAQVSFINSAKNLVTSTTCTVSYSPTAGNTVIIGFSTAGTVSSVTDSNSTSYSQIIKNTTNGNSYLYGLVGVASGITSFTVTVTASSQIWCGVAEYSGVAGFGPPTSNNASGSFTSFSIAWTSVANNDFFVTMWSVGQGATSPSATTGTIRQESSSGDSFVLMDNTASTPASIANALSWSPTNASFYAYTGVELVSVLTFKHVQGANCAGGCTSNSAAATTLVVTLTSNPATGDLVVCGFGQMNSAVTSVKDGNNNAYTVTPHSPSNAQVGTAGDAYLFYLLSAPSNANKTITITFPSAANSDGFCDEFAILGGTGTISFDKDVAGSGTTGTAINTPSLTPTNQAEVLVAYGSPASHISNTAVAAPWTFNPAGLISGGGSGDEYTLAGASQTANFTQASSGAWDSIIAAFSVKGATAKNMPPVVY